MRETITDRLLQGKRFGSQYSTVLGQSVHTVKSIGKQGIVKRVTPDDRESLQSMNLCRYKPVKAGLDDVVISHKIIPCSPGYWRFNGRELHADDANVPKPTGRRAFRKLMRKHRKEQGL